MAINLTTNPTTSGRITAANSDYPYGSAKDETSAGAGDGTPYFKARADDIFGMQQALLRLAGITPSGDAETALDSEYTKAIAELAAGRAVVYDEDGTSAADAYVLALRSNQQGVNSLFDGLRVLFTAAADNTGASTVDVSEVIGEAVGTTIKSITLPDGSALAAGDISGRTFLIYNSTSDRFELLFAQDDGLGIGQTWQDVTSSRSVGVTYTNSTGRPIQLAISINPTTATGTLVVDSVTVAEYVNNPDSQSSRNNLFAIVPNGSTYRISQGSLSNWSELR